jgi:hypothetical protein
MTTQETRRRAAVAARAAARALEDNRDPDALQRALDLLDEARDLLDEAFTLWIAAKMKTDRVEHNRLHLGHRTVIERQGRTVQIREATVDTERGGYEIEAVCLTTGETVRWFEPDR